MLKLQIITTTQFSVAYFQPSGTEPHIEESYLLVKKKFLLLVARSRWTFPKVHPHSQIMQLKLFFLWNIMTQIARWVLAQAPSNDGGSVGLCDWLKSLTEKSGWVRGTRVKMKNPDRDWHP